MTSTTMTPIDVEHAIVARLNERLKDTGLVKFVYDTSEYGNVEEESQLVPAAAVIYNGYRAGEQLGNGAVQVVNLEFLVVVVARSSTKAMRATGAKADASVIFDAAIRALSGWKPARGMKSLTLGDAPGAGYSDAGFTYIPIAFNSRITYTPQP